MGQARTNVRDRLKALSENLRETYISKRRVMSFAEYLELVEETPMGQLRSAPQYMKDCFDHWGTEQVSYPWGDARRFKIFDCPWSDSRDRLLGQETVQNRVYRALENFVSEGAANKLILLHGPNGSAKSTLVRCIGRGMQAYSELEAGALYRFNWVFPGQKVARGDIGFSGGDYASSSVPATESYAYLPDDLVDAKVCDELRDHPLLLLPPERRRALMSDWLEDKEGEFVVSDYLRFGRLSHRNRAIFEALLTNYQGDYLKVLRHVQVERFFVSHRYREGYVTVEPQLSVDAVERQITQDSSVAALPAALQSLTLFNYGGQLVNGNRGLIEYSDLLKRPLEAYKYLLTTVEQASVSLHNASLFLDMCFIGTSNEIHLSAFKEVPEFQSFKGRLELIRVPYLLDRTKEELIYEAKLKEAARSKHVAPHCAYVAAQWAVLTRLRKPNADRYPKEISDIINRLSPLEKAELYSEGRVPQGLTSKVSGELKAHLGELRAESESFPAYEGRTGASPRELQSVIFNAANSPAYDYVSPMAILHEMEELCKQVSVYDFLKQEPSPGGYQDHRQLIVEVRKRLLELVYDEFRAAMGLVEDVEYQRLFSRYITHVTHYTKGEKLRNENTGKNEAPDEKMMREVESTLGNEDEPNDFRRALISKIGAWSLDHPDTLPIFSEIFHDHFAKLRESYFRKHDALVEVAVGNFLKFMTDGKSALAEDELSQAETILQNMKERFHYTNESARDIVRVLIRERHSI